jgi:ribose/xylose/arabinose/galactoside ABC-type transport system permease subunit
MSVSGASSKTAAGAGTNGALRRALFNPTVAIYLVLLVVCIVGLIVSPGFRTSQNLINVLYAVSYLGIVAVGMTYVTLSGSAVDMSVGATVAASATTAVLLLPYGLLPAIIAGMIMAVLIGAVNGVLIGYLRANSVIITVGSASVVAGLVLTISGGRIIYSRVDLFNSLSDARILGIPLPVVIFLLVTVLAHLHVQLTVWGRRLLGIGMNREVMRLSGLKPDSLIATTLMISAGAAGISGIMLASANKSATPSLGSTFPFDAITAVVLGGARLQGGKGTILGTLAGVVLVGVLNNLMVLVGIPFPYQQVIKGVILAAALGAQTFLGSKGRA